MGSRNRPSSLRFPRGVVVLGLLIAPWLVAGACTDILGIEDRTLLSGSGGSGGSTTTTGTGGIPEGADPCKTDADCKNSYDGHLCDPVKLICVECVNSEKNSCAGGLYCDAAGACSIGCDADADCNPNAPNGLKCNRPTHLCTGCDANKPCPPGTKCAGGTCEPGCDGTEDCPTSEWQCCGDQCRHTTKDTQHCGTCDHVCPDPTHTKWKCGSGECIGFGCVEPWDDCDNDTTEIPGGGCETDLLTSNDDCGACGKPCTVKNGSGKCEGGACTVSACADSWKDCNADASDGCESDTLQDKDNCATCGHKCSDQIVHASVACMVGDCVLVACDSGWANCDGVNDNGCECPDGTGGTGGGTGGTGGMTGTGGTGGIVDDGGVGDGGPNGGSGGGTTTSSSSSSTTGGSGGGTTTSSSSSSSTTGGSGGGTTTSSSSTSSSSSMGGGGSGGGTTTSDTAGLCQSPAGVACPGQFSCTAGFGCCLPMMGSPSCLSAFMCSAASGKFYQCDDKNDCVAGQVCCHNAVGGSVCVMDGMCPGGGSGLFELCSLDSAGAPSCQCSGNQQCCPPKVGGKDATFSSCQPTGAACQ